MKTLKGKGGGGLRLLAVNDKWLEKKISDYIFSPCDAGEVHHLIDQMPYAISTHSFFDHKHWINLKKSSKKLDKAI